MHRTTIVLRLVLLAAVALALPLRSDGIAQCDNVTTSLASTANNPVAGDEKFFTLPIGPSNVMFMLDVSGSMNNVPQCGDASVWGDTGALATCKYPTFGAQTAGTVVVTVGGSPVTVPAANTVTGDGTCAVSGNTNLAWMTTYTPTTALVDPGHGTGANGLVDAPPWGTGCVGDACLFQADKAYTYGSWTETTAPGLDVASACTVTKTYTDFDCSSKTSVTKTITGTLPNCVSCLSNTAGKGFYFHKNWTLTYTTNDTTGSGTSKKCVTPLTTTSHPIYAGGSTGSGTSTALMTGGWLNANPPKFMSARKVIKDIAWIDPNTTQPTDPLRLGVSYFSTAAVNTVNPSAGCPVTIPNYAAIIVPLGPSAANSYPVNSTAYVEARQTILDALNHTHGGAAGWPTGVSNLPDLACGGTPMATALFHVGQYFSSRLTYTNAFGASYELADYAQSTSGWMKAPWVTSSSTSFCWSCQKSAIIVVTDGSPNSEMTFPTGIRSAGSSYTNIQNCGPGNTTACRSVTPLSNCCSPSDSTSNPPSYVPRVADWLHNHDLVPSALNSTQSLLVSTISFNLPDGNARTILKATANMGGGQYKEASDGAALAAAVSSAVNLVSNTATSFGAPAATALTTINAVDTKAFITRFKPTQKPTWEGHLFQWMLFDKAAAGCDPTKKPDPSDPTQVVSCRGREVLANFDGATTRDGYNACSGSFLVDADCDEVEEDSATGAWYKKGTGGTAANMFWDAGKVLSTPTSTGYRTAAEHDDPGNIAPYTKYAPGKTPRNLWTSIYDGTKYVMYELETKNAVTLAPYMNLDQTWCSSFESMAKLCGASPLPSCPVTIAGNWQTYCAQQVILFARGWDVMDQDGDGCAGPGYGTANPSGVQPNPNNGTSATSNALASGTTSCVLSASGSTNYTGEERDRPNDAVQSTTSTAPSFYKLGDIFHSSPVLVHPPTPESICRLGTDNQCVRTIFGYANAAQYQAGYQTLLDKYDACTSGAEKVDAYRAWRTDLASRQNVVLVGANDGFLHAFDAGGQDTTTGTQDKDCVWPNVTDGTGAEIWGVLPPDLLPRLRDTVQNHQYMVDGNIMVRDIWVDGASADGSTNNPVSADGNSADGEKQKNEFRTVAIIGERSGGTKFTGLDITKAFSMTTTARPRPTIRWSFPTPLSDDAQYVGQSWSDFSPRPPPIGAVRLIPDTGETATGSFVPPNAASGTAATSFVEKWVVMLNGGYDPTLVRGRAVWMLDAWSGSKLWRYTDTDFKANVMESDANTTAGMFPVPAGIAMLDIGDPSRGLDSDNFFDTATWGDMGGNLFVARFDWPGKRTGGVVQNWRAARTFEQGRQAGDTQLAGNRTEFFYMTTNALEPQKRRLHTMIGSGNREQILEQGQTCGPDNVMSCCQAGCTVTTTSTFDYGVCKSTNTFSCNSSGQMTSAKLDQACPASGATACTGGASNTFTNSSRFDLNCSSTANTVGTGKAVCDANGLCTVTPIGTSHDVTPASASTCDNKAKFYGIWSYGGDGKKIFATRSDTDWSEAVTFDKNRFTDAAGFTKSDVCDFTPDGTCSLVNTTNALIKASGKLSCDGGATTCRLGDTSCHCQAGLDDPGWFYTYNVTCPTAVSCGTGCTNEKTASGAAVVNSCATWNSFMPKGSAASGTDPCSVTGTARQTAIGYASHFVTGTPDLVCNEGQNTAGDVVYRGAQRSTIAPPAAPQVRYSTSQTGRVYYSTLQLDPQSPPSNTSLGGRDIASPLYWLELSRQGHLCRHNGTNCD